MISHTTGLPEQELHIWARPDQGATLANFSLNLRSDRSGVIQFSTASDGVEIHNPTLNSPTAKRYQFVLDSDTCPPLAPVPCIDVTSDSVNDLEALTVTDPSVGLGLGPATTSIDSLYSSAEDAWLLATVKYSVTAPDITKLYLQIGENGILNQGSDQNSPADLDVVFGSDRSNPLSSNTNSNRECDVDCDPMNKPQTADAVIRVAPVPSSEWSGVTAGDWSQAGRWVGPGGAPPAATDNALIDVTGSVVTVSDSQAAYTTTIDDGELTLASAGLLTSLLVTGADGRVSGTGTIKGLVINDLGTISPGGATLPPLVGISAKNVAGSDHSVAGTPEPHSAVLFVISAVGLIFRIRRQNK